MEVSMAYYQMTRAHESIIHDAYTCWGWGEEGIPPADTIKAILTANTVYVRSHRQQRNRFPEDPVLDAMLTMPLLLPDDKQVTWSADRLERRFGSRGEALRQIWRILFLNARFVLTHLVHPRGWYEEGERVYYVSRFLPAWCALSPAQVAEILSREREYTATLRAAKSRPTGEGRSFYDPEDAIQMVGQKMASVAGITEADMRTVIELTVWSFDSYLGRRAGGFPQEVGGEWVTHPPGAYQELEDSVISGFLRHRSFCPGHR